ncbi:MAG: EAL domain-containing protein [Motiliproteus sp.]
MSDSLPRSAVAGQSVPIIRMALFSALAWTLVVGISALWNLRHAEQLMVQRAASEARIHLEKDLIVLSWGTEHLGVYGAAGLSGPPYNLSDGNSENTVATTDGQILTLIPPASMMLQMMSRYQDITAIEGRFTALDVINPANKADQWERQQINLFRTQGLSEVWEITEHQGVSYMRFLRPRLMEQQCLACHQKTSIKPGEVAGAVGVKLPLTEHLSRLEQQNNHMWASHGFSWLFGLAIIFVALRSVLAKIADSNRVQQRYQDLFEQSLDGILLVDPDTMRAVEFNQVAHQTLGYSRDEFSAKTAFELEAPDAVGNLAKQLALLRLSGAVSFESQYCCKDGSIRDFLVTGKLISIADKQMIQSSFHDITMRKVAQRQIAEERDRGQLYLDTVQSLMLALDDTGKVTMINRFGRQLLGYREAELVGKDWFTTCLPEFERESQVRPYFTKLMEGKIEQQHYFENILITASGEEVLIAWHNALLFDNDGNIVGTLSSGEDITQRKAIEQEVHNLAFYDPLTSLPNRRLLVERIKHSMAESERDQRFRALLFMDLDNFKHLNDTQGHDVGDQLLIETAQRIRDCIREVDSVSRHGGDEFIVLLEHLDDQANDAAAQTVVVVDKILAQLNKPYMLERQQYQSSISIGITLYKGHEHSLDELLKRSDMAMYQSKSAGRNRYHFFDPRMQVAINARAELENDLLLALKNQDFELHYQPQVDPSGRCVAVEALLRWRSGTRGLVSPAQFIELAEETQLILPIGYWVFQQACRQLLRWARGPDTAHLCLSVNVSALQFKRDDFAQQLIDLVQLSGINPTLLKLEITESVLVDDVDQVISKMEQLQRAGVTFALDDFGTGYSSLSYLKQLPLDQLKIDISFVRDMLSNSNGEAICRAIVSLGQSLELEVVAEGVESTQQWQLLQQQGCALAQGQLFAKPMVIERFDSWLADLNAHLAD